MAVTLTTSGSINTSIDNYGIAVLSTTSSVRIAGFGLIINVPYGCNINNIKTPITLEPVYNFQNNKLYVIATTASISGIEINTNSVILEITASGLSTGSFELDTTNTYSNSFVSSSGVEFDNFSVRIPGLSNPNAILANPSGFVIGVNSTATAVGSFAEGVNSLASGYASHAAGVNTTASGYAAFSTGVETDADGVGSFAAGSGSNATGTASFAGGIRSLASGIASFAVGSSTTASGVASLTAGTSTRATAQGSVAFGSSTIAQGVNSFAIGSSTTANTEASFAAGIGTFTEAIGQTTVGQWNDKLSDTKNVFLIGGGLGDSIRHNLFRAVGGKNSTNGDAERQIIIDVTSPTPELRSNSFFVVSGSSKFITGTNETIELSGPTTITGTNTLSVDGTTTLTGRLTANGAITTTSITASAVSASLVGTSNNVNLQLQTNNTTRVFISSSGNVGIGTTTPTERLHVDGNLLVTGRITAEEFHTEFVSASIIYQSGSTQFGNSSDDTHIFTGSLRVNGSITGSLFGTSSWAQNSLTSSFITPTGTNAFVQGGNSFGATALLGTNDTQDLQLETSGSVRVHISSSGNVGIGTTSPTQRLDVRDGFIQVSGSGAAGQGITIARAGLDTYQLTHEDGGLTIKNFTDNVKEMSFGGNGNVGINFQSPLAKLHISGASALRLQNAGFDTFQWTFSSGTGIELRNVTDGTNPFFVGGTDNVGISTTNPLRRLHVDASGSSNTNVPLLLTSVDTNNRVGILFASSSLSAGRQHYLYHRVSTPTVDWVLDTSAGENATWNFLPIDDTNYTIQLRAPVNGGTARITTGLSQSLFSLGAGGTANQHLNISSSGNVGIGTTTPTQRLDVRGNTIIAGTTPLNPVGGTLEVYNNASNAVLVIHEDSGSAEGRLWFRTEGSDTIFRNLNTRFSIDAETKSDALTLSLGGRVGIGTSTSVPSSLLHVRGEGATSATTALRVENSNQNASLVVLDNGNVGIGTTAPSASLHVQGNLQISTGSLYTYGQNTDIDSGSIRTVMSVSTGSYRAAFFDYVLNKSTNARAGIVFSVWNGTSVEWNDVSTNDIGNTTEVNLSVGLSGANVVLYASSSTNDWSVKALARML